MDVGTVIRSVLITLVCSCFLYSHPGGTDSQSGHNNRKTGDYHFHLQHEQAFPDVWVEESRWRIAFNHKVLQGELEYEIEGNSVDILTDEYAVEVVSLSQWQAGVTQALDVARQTDKNPGLAIILESPELDIKTYKECQSECRKKEIKLWVVNNHVTEDDLKVAQVPQATEVINPKKKMTPRGPRRR